MTPSPSTRRRPRSSSAASRQGPGTAHADAETGADPRSAARTICLRLLTVRPRTRAELAQALHRRGVPDDAAADVLARFAEVNLVDDAAFAASFARSSQHYRGLGRRAVAAGLRRRGVEDDVVAQTLATIGTEDELAAAQSVARRRMRTLGGLEPAVQARRLLGALARRGFSGELAWQVVHETLRGADGAGIAEDDEHAPAAGDDDPNTDTSMGRGRRPVNSG